MGLKKIFDKTASLYNSQKVFIASRLFLNGLWQNEVTHIKIEDYDFKTRILLVEGKRQRHIIVDSTTSQLIRLLCKNRKGKIIDLTDSRLSFCLSEVCERCNIRVKQPASALRNAFITFSIAKGRNAASVYAQAGQPLKNIPIPSLEDRAEDFDSKPII